MPGFAKRDHPAEVNHFAPYWGVGVVDVRGPKNFKLSIASRRAVVTTDNVIITDNVITPDSVIRLSSIV